MIIKERKKKRKKEKKETIKGKACKICHKKK